MPSPSRAARLIASLESSSQFARRAARAAREARVRDLAGARARLAHEQGLLGERGRLDLPSLIGSRPGLAMPTISSERNGVSSIRSSTCVSPTRASWTRPASSRSIISPVEAISTSTIDVRVVAPEAAERVRQEVDAGRRRGADVDRAGLEAGERVKFLLAGSQRRERLARARGKHTARLGQAAAATVPLDEPLSSGGLEQAQVLARARLSDPDRPRRSRDASRRLDLDEQPEAGGVPEERERGIGHDDARYRDFRLAR